jgi:hypothetical protein
MFPPEIFRVVLEDFTRHLGERGIRFALTGGMVSAFHAEPRYTQDADILLDRTALLIGLEDTLREWKARGYLFDESATRVAIERGRPFQLFHSREALKLDLYPRELIPGELSRAVPAEVFAGVWLPIVSRVDAAGGKLVWIDAGSHKSRRDLRQIVRRCDDAERQRLTEIAVQLKLSHLLNEVLAESDEIDR